MNEESMFAMGPEMKTIVFAVAGYNLGETGRMIEIARVARKHFRVLFASYGGQFEELIEEQGFPLTRLEPRLTREQLDRLRMPATSHVA